MEPWDPWWNGQQWVVGRGVGRRTRPAASRTAMMSRRTPPPGGMGLHPAPGLMGHGPPSPPPGPNVHIPGPPPGPSVHIPPPAWGWNGPGGGYYGGPPGPFGGPPGGGDGPPPGFNLWLVDVDKFGGADMVVKSEQQVGQGDQDTLQQQQHDQFTAVLPCVLPGASGRVTVILPDGQKPSDPGGGWQSSQQACPANPSANTLEPVGVIAQPAATSGYGVGQWAGGNCCTGGYRRCPLPYAKPLGSPCNCSGEGYQYGIMPGYVCP